MTPWTVTPQNSCPWDSPGKNNEVCCHSFLQGIFPTQRANPGLLYCRQILYHLSCRATPEEGISALLRREHGEGNGTPLQYSCLENPVDGGLWWVAVHEVAKSQTRLSDFTFSFHFSLSCIGEGNGIPLQCSCLENPRDGGAWWAAVSGVTQSRTRLK